MANETPKESAAIVAQRTAFEELKRATDRARVQELDGSHGRNVGGLALPVVREQLADELKKK